MDSIDRMDNKYSTVKGAGFDAAFYGVWLQRIAEADRLLRKLRASKKTDAKKLERLDDFCILDLQGIAINMIADVARQKRTHVAMYSYEAESLAILSSLGFLTLEWKEYVLSIPTGIDEADIARAVAFLADSEDARHMFHPEKLLFCREIPPQGLGAHQAGSW